MAKYRSPASSDSLKSEIIVPEEAVIPILRDTSFFVNDEPIDKSPAVTYNSNVDRVSIQLKFPAKVTRSGLVSGEQYEWSDAGAIVQVLEEDVDQLLQLKVGEAGCCGGSPNFLFERV